MTIKNLLLSLSLFVGTITNGSILEYNHATPDYLINYVESFYVPKFDPSLGTLEKIEFSLTGNFKGASRTENLSSMPVTITLKNSVNFKQSFLNNYDIFDEIITRTDVFNALPWDGSFPPDWTGNSGYQFLFDNYMSHTFVLEKSDMSSLALFTGMGDVLMTVSAKDISSTSMSGNNIVASQFENFKNTLISVKYHYTAVPEPKVYGYVGIFFCFLLIFIRKFKK